MVNTLLTSKDITVSVHGKMEVRHYELRDRGVFFTLYYSAVNGEELAMRGDVHTGKQAYIFKKWNEVQ